MNSTNNMPDDRPLRSHERGPTHHSAALPLSGDCRKIYRRQQLGRDSCPTADFSLSPSLHSPSSPSPEPPAPPPPTSTAPTPTASSTPSPSTTANTSSSGPTRA